MIIIPFAKFVRHSRPTSVSPLQGVADDGAGRQPDRRRVGHETAGGPRQIFTPPPARLDLAEKPSRGDNHTAAGGQLPRIPALDELAFLMRTLTYGDMIALGAGIGQTCGGGEISQLELPAALYLWATERAT